MNSSSSSSSSSATTTTTTATTTTTTTTTTNDDNDNNNNNRRACLAGLQKDPQAALDVEAFVAAAPRLELREATVSGEDGEALCEMNGIL